MGAAIRGTRHGPPIWALTNPSDATRKLQYASVFRTLGHLIHLVQDAAVPAHTRNDPHLALLDSDRFEKWSNSESGLVDIGGSGKTFFAPVF